MEEIYYKEGSLFLKQLFTESLGLLIHSSAQPCQQSGHHVLKPKWLQEPGQAGPSLQLTCHSGVSLTCNCLWGPTQGLLISNIA